MHGLDFIVPTNCQAGQEWERAATLRLGISWFGLIRMMAHRQYKTISTKWYRIDSTLGPLALGKDFPKNSYLDSQISMVNRNIWPNSLNEIVDSYNSSCL
jgi:hypothetical protein